MKKSTLLLLFLVFLLGLTACGTKEEGEKEPDRYGGIRYIPAFQALDTDVEEFQSGCVVGDYVYLAGSAVTNEDYHDREARLLRISLEDGGIEEIPGCEPPSGDRNVITSGECLAVAAGEEDTLWLLESVGRWVYDFPEDFDPYDMASGIRGEYYISSEGSYILHRLDQDGNELFRQEWLRKELEDQLGLDYINETFISAGGDITFWDSSRTNLLMTMDKTGALLGQASQADTDLEWYGVVRLGDGRLAVYGTCRNDGAYSMGMQALSRNGGAWEESWALPDFTSVYSGNADALFYYNEGNDLLAWRDPAPLETGETPENAPLLSWVNTGLDGNGDRAVTEFLPDGRLVVVQGGVWSGEEPAELVVLTPTNDPPEKTVLTLGTAQLMASMEDAVRKFNRTNQDYCIEVREYIDYSAGESWQDGMTRLATEVGAGKIPDILDTYGMPLAGWASSGMLEDLWPWIDRDRDIDREDLMLRVLEADSIGGKLYEVGSGFSFTTMAGLRDIVGDRIAWTPEDMYQVLETMPEGSQAVSISREWVLEMMLKTFWDRFVDQKKGMCSFDSEEFREILAFCDQLPVRSDLSYREQEEMLREGELMLLKQSPGSFWDLQQIRADYGSTVSFVGFPNPWGDVGSSFDLSSPLAMTSAGKHKEGAWAFLRTMLLPEGQPSSLFVRRFPLNKEAFDEMARMDGNGRYVYSDSKGKMRPYSKASQADYDKVMALYEAVDHVYRWDDNLGSIIMEIAGAYFAGDKTLDETVELVQNRANLYINEQK